MVRDSRIWCRVSVALELEIGRAFSSFSAAPSNPDLLSSFAPPADFALLS